MAAGLDVAVGAGLTAAMSASLAVAVGARFDVAVGVGLYVGLPPLNAALGVGLSAGIGIGLAAAVGGGRDSRAVCLPAAAGSSAGRNAGGRLCLRLWGVFRRGRSALRPFAR